MATKKIKTTKVKSKTVPLNKELVKKSSAIAKQASSAFAAIAKGSVFSKCKKNNLQRVLQEYV